MIARLQLDGLDLTVDLTRPVSLAIKLRLDGRSPQFFGAPAAQATPLVAGNFIGRIADGASCNCHSLLLTPHCNGTHTESAGHLTREALDVCDVAPREPLLALVLSVVPVVAEASGESSDPAPLPGDHLITRAALISAWPASHPTRNSAKALVLRTQARSAVAAHDEHGMSTANRDRFPYLSREAAQLLVERGVEHLVIDQPSIDRAADQGRLCAHRIFFGLAPGSHALAEVRRRQCTITELAQIPPETAYGWAMMVLALPRIAGDAVPSQPWLYAPQET